MIITRVEAIPLTIPTRRTISWAAGRYTGLTTVLVKVETDVGLVGTGEADGRHAVHQATITAGIGELARYLIGMDPQDLRSLRERILSDMRWHFHSGFGERVIAGIEMACWDLIGQDCGQPLYRLFGGTERPISYFYYVLREDPDEVQRNVAAAYDAGHRWFYLKVGYGRGEDTRRIAAVREALGPDGRIRIDAIDAWNSPQVAIDEINRLAAYDLDWVEQPVPWWDVNGLARVRQGVGVQIAAHQAVRSLRDVLSIIEARAADVIVCDAQGLGGLAAVKAAGEMCAAAGLRLCKQSLESGWGTLASLHVLTSLDALVEGNQIYVPQLQFDIVEPVETQFQRGCYLSPPSGAGIGATLSEVNLARAREAFLSEGAALPASAESVAESA